jgi:prevent-host-death family protein
MQLRVYAWLHMVIKLVNNMVMLKVNIFEAKARLSEYLDRAAQGERIVVCRHNTPVAELRPVTAVRTEPRPVGPLPGRPVFEVPSSFFEPLPDDELESWEGAMPSYPLPGRASAAKPPRVAEGRAGGNARTRTGKTRRR